MSDEKHDDEGIDVQQTPATPPTIRELELQPRDGATHWSISRIERDGFIDRLAFSVSADRGQAIGFAPVASFSAENVRTLFGAGHYKISWRQMPEGTRRNLSVGNDELILRERPGAAPSPPATSSAPRARICQACGAQVVSRFCGECSTPIGATRPPAAATTTPAPSTAAPASLADIMALLQTASAKSFSEGVTFATSALRAATEIARTDVDRARIDMEERARKNEADSKERLAETKQRHEKELQEREQFADKVAARRQSDEQLVDKIDRLVTERVDALRAELAAAAAEIDDEEENEDENDADIEVEEEEKPRPSGVWKEVVTSVVQNVGPMVNAVGEAVAERIRANGGAAPHAPSGEPT